MFTFAIPIYGSRIGLSASSIGLVLGSFPLRLRHPGLLPAISRRLTAWPLSRIPGNRSRGLLPVSAARARELPDGRCLPARP